MSNKWWPEARSGSNAHIGDKAAGALGGEHPKRRQSVEPWHALMLDRMLRIETKIDETLEHQRNGDLRLGTSQRRPEAIMRPAAKGEMARVRPLHIEAVRVGVPRRVMAGRDE